MKLSRVGIILMLILAWLLDGTLLPAAHMAEGDVNAPAAVSYFGQRVALDGDTALVGANMIDSAYVFDRNRCGADAWGATKELFALGGPGTYTDYPIAISGDIAVVGAPYDNRVSIFYRNQGGPGNWGRVKVIQGSGDFGKAVSINGDIVVVGAYTALIGGQQKGAAYVFQRNWGGTDNWGQVKQLSAADGAAGGFFGYSVAVKGDVVVVGLPNIGQGAAYIFYRNQGGLDNWGQVKKITPSGSGAKDGMGSGVSIDGDTIVAGAVFATVDGKSNQGAAYVFNRNQGGLNNWGQVKKIVASDGAAYDQFGDVSIHQDTIVVGAPWADIGGNDNQGAAYVFYRNQGGANNWGQVRKLTASDGAVGHQFGGPQVNGNTIIVGTWSGEAAYIFYRDQGGANNWGQVKKLIQPDFAPPTNPTSLTSSSHTVNVWSNDNTVDVAWSGASDDNSCGIDGYSLLWDNSAFTVPDTTKDVEETVSTTTSPALGNGSWYFHIRSVDGAGNWAVGAAHLGPFKIDITPPTSWASAPEFALGPFEVRWAGTDAGSGVANYDVWVRDGLGGTWTQWQSGTSAVNATFTDIITGHTYYFRSLAHDVAGNLEADLPADGDTHTTIATYQVTGQVTNNRKQPVFNATVSVNPAALNTAKTSGAGSHTLFFGSSGAYTLTASRTGYGALPPRFDVNVDSNLSGVDFVLPPLNDVVSNGGWESGDSSGWSVGTGLTTTVEMTAAHTGHYGVRLDSSGSGGIDFAPSITQSVVISAEWARPTLSWLYQVTQANPSDTLLVVVSSGNTSITATVPITIGMWQHGWLDLSAFSGQTVTLQFGFQTQAAGQQILLDEVSVGDSAVGVYLAYLPLIRRNS